MSSTQTETRSIVVEFDLPQSAQRVWRALTDPRLIEQWLMPNDFQALVGHRFQFHTQPVEGWDGTIHCQVTAVEPPTRLAYTWVGGADEIQGYGHRLDTSVTWTLTSTPSGTHVRLEHAGFRPEDSFAYEGMGKGWLNVADGLQRALDSMP